MYSKSVHGHPPIHGFYGEQSKRMPVLFHCETTLPKQEYFKVKSLCGTTDCSPLFHFKRQANFTRATENSIPQICVSSQGSGCRMPRSGINTVTETEGQLWMLLNIKPHFLICLIRRLFFILKYNQIHVSKTNSQNKTPCYIIKVYFSLLLQHISPPKIQKQLPRILCCCHKCSFCGS